MLWPVLPLSQQAMRKLGEGEVKVKKVYSDLHSSCRFSRPHGSSCSAEPSTSQGHRSSSDHSPRWPCPAGGTGHGELQHGREGRREKERWAEGRAEHIFPFLGSLLCPRDCIGLCGHPAQHHVSNRCMHNNSGAGRPSSKGPGS